MAFLHVLSVSGSRASVLYLDREADGAVLKLATRDVTAARWNLDVVEPVGEPVAVIQGPTGPGAVFWAAGDLLSRDTATGSPTVRFSPFTLSGRPSLLGSSGFTAYDARSRALLQVRVPGDVRTIAVPGATHSSILTSDGRLAVLSWDGQTRRLLLFEERGGSSSFDRSTVTLSEDTGTVVLLPGRGPSRYMFLFDEARRQGAGKVTHDLSLIAPAGMLGRSGQRYLKAILMSGPRPIPGFAAVETADALYVLAVQGNLRLLRVALAP